MTAKPTQSKKKRIIQKEVFVKDLFVSVIVALRNDTTDDIDVAEYLRDLGDLLYRHYSNYEIIIVDNQLKADLMGSVIPLLAELPCIRVIQLSRKYPHDTAIMSGLEGSIGDYTVITDPSLDNPKEIIKIVDENSSADIVQGIAVARRGQRRFRQTLSRRLFYWYGRKFMHINVPTNSTYFIALSRRAIRALTTSGRSDTHVRQMVAHVGFTYKVFPYETRTNPVQSHSLRVGAIEAIDIVSSYSVHPLRFMAWIGFVASIASVIYALYVVYIAATRQHVAEGWTTMSLQISGLFFILFLMMVILAEYIGKIMVESRKDARYTVLDEQSSTVALADTGRRNVTS